MRSLPSDEVRRTSSAPNTVDAPGLRESRPPAHSLHVGLFSVLAAILLLSVTGLVEFSIRTHRAQAIAVLSLQAQQILSQVPADQIEALESADEEALRSVADTLFRDSRVVSVRLHPPAPAPALEIAGAGRAPVSLPTPSGGGADYRSEIVRLEDRWILTLATPLEIESNREGDASPKEPRRTGTLALAIDASETRNALVIAAGQARKAQAAVAAAALLALWLVTRAMAVRPLESIAETLEGMNEDSGGMEFPRPKTAEAHRLTRAITRMFPDSRREAAQSARERWPRGSRREAILPSRPLPESSFPEEDSQRSAPSSSTSATASQRLSVGPHRILVVEDNPVNRSVAVGMLESLGCQVACAEDGLVSIAMMEQDRFDLVFMDIQMPRLDGLEATRRIRERELADGTDSTPIVALTAHFTDADRLDSARAGMQGHISKPFSREDLATAILEWCGPAKDPSDASATAGADDNERGDA